MRVALDTLEAQRVMFGGVGLDLRTVQADFPHLEAAQLLSHDQNLVEEHFEIRQEPKPEGGDRVMIGMCVSRDISEGHRVVGCRFDLAARARPGRVRVEQERHQHLGMVCRRSAPFVAVADRSQVQLPDNVDHEPGQVAFRNPILQTRRHQEQRVAIVRNEVVSHAA